MTKKQYIRQLLEETKVSLPFLKSLYLFVKCNCDHPICLGWKTISKNNPDELKEYIKQKRKEKMIISFDDDLEIINGKRSRKKNSKRSKIIRL